MEAIQIYRFFARSVTLASPGAKRPNAPSVAGRIKGTDSVYTRAKYVSGNVSLNMSFSKT